MPLTSGELALCARLRGRPRPLTPGLIAAARHHRLHLVLAASLSSDETSMPDGQALRRDLHQAAALDAYREQDLAGLLADCGAEGVDVLVLKGAALAYTIYAAPHLRPRIDTDVMIRADAVPALERILAARGWTRPAEPERRLSAAQSHYLKPGPAGTTSHLDVHWKIANPRVFADALSFDELRGRAVPIPPLGRGARACAPIHALLLACIHRVAHHADAIDLLWLWDIHLLAERLSAAERLEFVALARRSAMTSVSHRGVALAADLFGGSTAADVAGLLSAAQTHEEPSAGFIGGATHGTTLAADLRTLPTWQSRARLIAEHLFPSRDYMRTRYAGWPPVLLPLAYVARIVRGAPGWLRRRGGESRRVSGSGLTRGSWRESGERSGERRHS